MSDTNSEQIEYWNAKAGAVWVDQQAHLDQLPLAERFERVGRLLAGGADEAHLAKRAHAQNRNRLQRVQLHVDLFLWCKREREKKGLRV